MPSSQTIDSRRSDQHHQISRHDTFKCGVKLSPTTTFCVAVAPAMSSTEIPDSCQVCQHVGHCSRNNYQSCDIWICDHGAVTQLMSWQCPVCKKIYTDERRSQDCFDDHKTYRKVIRAWQTGKTLAETLSLCRYPQTIPDHLRNVTKNTCFQIPHIACHDHYAYHITDISENGIIRIAGRWRVWCNMDKWDATSGEYQVSHHDLSHHKELAELTADERKMVV